MAIAAPATACSAVDCASSIEATISGVADSAGGISVVTSTVTAGGASGSEGVTAGGVLVCSLTWGEPAADGVRSSGAWFRNLNLFNMRLINICGSWVDCGGLGLTLCNDLAQHGVLFKQQRVRVFDTLRCRKNLDQRCLAFFRQRFDGYAGGQKLFNEKRHIHNKFPLIKIKVRKFIIAGNIE
jgi:hypothetical protein